MPGSHVIIRDGHESHQLDIARRDWGLLTGPFFDEGQRFVDALGVYEHFTVATGLAEGSQVMRQRFRLIDATQSLHRAVVRDEDLLCHDYSYGFSRRGRSRSSAGESGFRVRGLIGYVDARPHGYCHLRLSQPGTNGLPRTVEFIDMRVRESIDTDDLGVLRIYRRQAEMHWQDRLPPLLEFLRARSAREVTVEHYD